MNVQRLYPGLRTIKTGISIALVLVFYYIVFPDNWSQRAVLAGTAAVVCLQDSVDKSLRSGGNRIIGTLIGAIFGCIVAVMGLDKINFYLWLVIAILIFIIIIQTLNLLHKKESIVIGCLVYMVIIVGNTAMPAIVYAIGRMLDTIVGIIFSAMINRFVFAPKPAKVIYKKSGERVEGLNYEIKRYGGYRSASRENDNMTEFYLYPEDSFWEDKDWGFCIFLRQALKAEIYLEKIKGYRRYLLCLDNSETLFHEGHYFRSLRKYEQDFFLADWDTKIKGMGTDFNLVVSADFEGALELIYNHQIKEIFKMNMAGDKETFKIGLYFLENEAKLSMNLKKSGTMVFNNNFSRGDFIIFDEPTEQDEEGFELVFGQDYCGDAVIAIMVKISRRTIE